MEFRWAIFPGMKEFGASNDEKILQYVNETFRPEDALLVQVRETQEAMNLPGIQVGPMDGLLLEVLTRAIGARKAVEIGTLGGYSAICITRGLAPSGKLFTFELDSKHAQVALAAFEKAGFSERIELILGLAAERLDDISAQGPFDLVFIDADKENYPLYLQWAAENLRIGGVVLGDNSLAFGMISDHQFDNAEDEGAVQALRAFNQAAAQTGRFRATLIPTGEGLTIGVKIR